MSFRLLTLLLGLFVNTGWADFSNALIQLHPMYPSDGPFVLEIGGEWSSDCHPGEQRPVIRAYDGYSVLIEFDFIVAHITCNQVTTPYRVLVDMSDVIGTVQGHFPSLEITVRFGESEFRRTVMLDCAVAVPCEEPPVKDIRPEEGVYSNPAALNQGLLLARQNQWLAAYPLIYDELGDSEWLIAAGEVVQDVFFGDLHELTGGQCLGCPPSDFPPRMDKVGKLTLLMDSEGIIQARFDDGGFSEFQNFVFGYRTFRVGENGERTLIGLEGRWGVSENRGTNPPLGDLTEFFPASFDLVLEDIVTADSQILPGGQVSYLVSTLAGEVLGQLVCKGQSGFDGRTNVCEYIDPTDAAEPLFLFYQDGPSSLSIEYGRPLIELVGVAPGGKAVRLD
jgi:hypothetical protein